MHAFLKTGTLGSGKEKPAAGPSKEDKNKSKHIPWVEKYRPRCVDDVAYQEEVVAVLKKSLKGSDLPNLLFYGPPGTGKTSTILAASRELFGEMFKTRVLELNASDERGINVIREKVKTFAQQTASGTRPDGKPCPPFKIVILDEADSMTNPAQAALRRTMEKESKTTRFCLICNYVSRIIEPIASRCAKFRFKPLAEDILTARLKGICGKENITCNEEGLKALLYTSEGDLRKAITFLQSASRLKPDDTITQADIFEIAGVIPDDVLDNLLTVCHSNSYEKLQATVQAFSHQGILDGVRVRLYTIGRSHRGPVKSGNTVKIIYYRKELINEGHAASQLILQLHDKIVQLDEVADTPKSIIMEKLAVVDKCLMDGADEFLQLMSLCSIIMQQFCK